MSYINSKTLNTIYLPERLLPSDAKRISEPDEFGRGVKFVRADVLLEWAKRMLVCFKPGFDCHETLKVVVEHIESL